MINAICLECGSEKMRRSKRRNFFEKLLAPLGGNMHRCHECDSRYLQFGASWLRVDDFRSAFLSVRTGAVLVAALGLVLAAVIWLG
jgi:fatty-acid desaturase